MPEAASLSPTEVQALSGIRIPLLSDALLLSDFAIGEPRPELKGKLTRITGYIQQVPNDGNPATEKTEVWLARTQTTLYFVFICHDRRPTEIRSHLVRRESLLNDNNVSVLFNPSGVQADALWTENKDPDYSHD